jgi:hypothetical protein
VRTRLLLPDAGQADASKRDASPFLGVVCTSDDQCRNGLICRLSAEYGVGGCSPTSGAAYCTDDDGDGF